jgi:hypothetical protein
VSGRIESLSLAALRMAASAEFPDPQALASWLYRFGTLPRTSTTDRDFGPEDDPMGVLGLTVGGVARRRIEAQYDALSLPGWYSFARAGSPAPAAPACKLYISPRPEVLAEAFPRVVGCLAGTQVRSFKIGRRIEGLLRPDKIIVYFDDRAEMDAVTEALHESLPGCPAHGVPFTADAGGNGLLSTGVDPPYDGTARSWRGWLTGRLAASLFAARAGGTDEDPVARALADIRRTGVDEHWNAASVTFGDDPGS